MILFLIIWFFFNVEFDRYFLLMFILFWISFYWFFLRFHHLASFFLLLSHDLHGLILVSSSLFYKINFFLIFKVYGIIFSVFFRFFFIRLFKLHVYGHVIDMDIFCCFLFFFEFHASTFFYWEFCYIVFLTMQVAIP